MMVIGEERPRAGGRGRGALGGETPWCYLGEINT